MIYGKPNIQSNSLLSIKEGISAVQREVMDPENARRGFAEASEFKSGNPP
jgi:hypothetical protein